MKKVRRCVSCGSVDHFQRDCLENKELCFGCNEEGHFYFHCPRLRGDMGTIDCTYLKERETVLAWEKIQEKPFTPDPLFYQLRSKEEFPCFLRHFVLFAPEKEKTNLRVEMVARMLTQAFLLGHGMRRNVIVDIWTREGVLRFNHMDFRNLHNTEDNFVQLVQRKIPIGEESLRNLKRPQEGEANVVSKSAQESRGSDELGLPTDIIDAALRVRSLYGDNVILLDEEGEKIEEFVKREAFSSLEGKQRWERPILIGHHDGMHPILFRLMQFNCTKLCVSKSSLLASSTIAIVHKYLDDLHTCNLKPPC